jgi:hypothetical protein
MKTFILAVIFSALSFASAAREGAAAWPSSEQEGASAVGTLSGNPLKREREETGGGNADEGERQKQVDAARKRALDEIARTDAARKAEETRKKEQQRRILEDFTEEYNREHPRGDPDGLTDY